jgi:hypothetical protein
MTPVLTGRTIPAILIARSRVKVSERTGITTLAARAG